jgi:hypothetical protein
MKSIDCAILIFIGVLFLPARVFAFGVILPYQGAVDDREI